MRRQFPKLVTRKRARWVARKTRAVGTWLKSNAPGILVATGSSYILSRYFSKQRSFEIEMDESSSAAALADVSNPGLVPVADRDLANYYFRKGIAALTAGTLSSPTDMASPHVRKQIAAAMYWITRGISEVSQDHTQALLLGSLEYGRACALLGVALQQPADSDSFAEACFDKGREDMTPLEIEHAGLNLLDLCASGANLRRA